MFGRKVNNKGLMICFEGLDGVGKTSQVELLNQYIKSLGFEKVFITKQPGGSLTLGNSLRGLLKSGAVKNPLAELFLFLADRAEHHLLIREKLEDGYIVLCDRYYYSTLAYQFAKPEIRDSFRDLNELSHWNLRSVDYFEPDVLIYLEMPINDIIERLKARELDGIKRDHFEESNYLNEVQSNYKLIMTKENLFYTIKFLKINALDSIESISEKINTFIKNKLPSL